MRAPLNHHKLKDALVIGVLFLLVFLARIPSLEEPFDNDSSANAYHARLILRGEPLYGTHHPAHHMPGPAYTYALAFALFGESDYSVKLLLIPWIAVAAWLIFKFGTRFKDSTVGWLAAIFFILLTASYKMKGTTAELELFANLPIIWGTFLALQYYERKERLSKLFWSGVFFGIVLIYKASLILFIGIVGNLLLVFLWQDIQEVKDWHQPLISFIKRGSALLAGILIVALLVLGYFASQGVLDRFLLIFSLGQGYLAYSSSLPAYRILLIPLMILAYNNAALLVLSLAGLSRLAHTIRRGNSISLPYSVALITWFLIAFLITGITRVGYVHYALVVVPPLVLIAAWEINNVSAQIADYLKLKGRKLIAPQVIIVVIVIASGLVFNYQSPYHYVRYRLGVESYEDYLTKGTFEGPALVESLRIASYLAKNTTPDDYIYTWSESPQIYFYSDRLSPIETIWPLYATAFGSYERIFVPQTQYVILGHSIYVEVPEWMFTSLEQNYHLETVMGDHKLYRRNDP